MNAPVSGDGTIKPMTDTPDHTVETPVDRLGVVYLPTSGTGVGVFHFVVDPDHGQRVEIGTPVAADTTEGTVIGMVVDMETVGTGTNPVRDELGASWEKEYLTTLPEVQIATVQVYASDRLRSIRAGFVRAATRAELQTATGLERNEAPIPAGVLSLATGEWAPVYLDSRALLGPESAHFLCSGLSGQAAKTSYATVLLRSAIASGGGEGRKVAALVFNVKGDDLIWLDRPPAPGYELTDEDHAIYEALGVPAEPFDNVTVYSPGIPSGAVGTRSRRDDATPLRWDLTSIWKYLHQIFPGLYEDEKASSFIAEFEDVYLRAADPNKRIDTFDKLDKWFGARIGEAAESGESMAWRSHHVATMRRLRRMLVALPARFGGLIVRGTAKESDDVPVKHWTHGQVTVVDIAGLRTDTQGVVIARTLDRVLKATEDGELGVDSLVVFADELNAFAPSVGGEMRNVRKILQRVATQGRYAGVSLFGLAQKSSKIDELVRDQAATRAVGVTPEAELSSGVYGRLSTGLTERIATLPKGSMALWHYAYRGALVVRFPRPAWRTGRAMPGSSRPDTLDGLDLSEVGRERITEGLAPETVEVIVSGAGDPERAKEALAKARRPDPKRQNLHEPSGFDPDDPFGIDG